MFNFLPLITIAPFALGGLALLFLFKFISAWSNSGTKIGLSLTATNNEYFVYQNLHITPAQQNQCRLIADKLKTALRAGGWMGLFEDEAAVIRELNTPGLTIQMIRFISDQYRQYTGYSLKDDVNRYLNDSQLAQINRTAYVNLL